MPRVGKCNDWFCDWYDCLYYTESVKRERAGEEGQEENQFGKTARIYSALLSASYDYLDIPKHVVWSLKLNNGNLEWFKGKIPIYCLELPATVLDNFCINYWTSWTEEIQQCLVHSWVISNTWPLDDNFLFISWVGLRRW